MKGFPAFLFYLALLALEYVTLSLAQSSCSSLKTLQADSSSTKVLTSPNYPWTYPSPSSCIWSIKAPYGHVIQLKFTHFKTYGGAFQTCTDSFNDILDVFNYHNISYKHLHGKYCGSTKPADVISSGRDLYLMFSAHSVTGGTGFRIEYKAVKKPVEDPYTCSPFNSYFTNNNIQLSALSYSKYIVSANYPNKYPSNIQCTWDISASSSSKVVKLTLSVVKIMNVYENSCLENSLKDSLTIRDGDTRYSPELKTFCGKRYSSTTVTSTGRELWIQFITNTDNYFSGSVAGFEGSYIETDKPDNTVSLIVGIIFGVIFVIGLLACCVCIAKRRGHAGYIRGNTAATVEMTTATTTHPPPGDAPQHPMQIQGGPSPASGSYQPAAGSYPQQPDGHYPQKAGGYPPPVGGTYPPPPPGGSYPPPPPGGSYPPPTGGSYPTPQPGGSYPPPNPGSSYSPSQPGGSYPHPPPGGSYPPPVNYPPPSSGYPPYQTDKVPDDPPPQYPGPPAYPQQPYNPQFQDSPPYPPPQGSENQPPYPATSQGSATPQV